MTEHTRWFEVWMDGASKNDWTYLLVLQTIFDGSLRLIDPQKSREIVRTFLTYEDAVEWLREDEYDLVEGRWFIAE